MWIRQGDQFVNLSTVYSISITDSEFIFRGFDGPQFFNVTFSRAIRISWCETFDIPPVLNNLLLVP